MNSTQKNILGTALKPCSNAPVTGFFRDGYCTTCEQDYGCHTVCAIVTKEFLDYTLKTGNDLVTPNPSHGFKGLVPGDKWCLCASRWLDAYNDKVAPPIDAEATHEKSLETISNETLLKALIK